jgi:transposase-like protein
VKLPRSTQPYIKVKGQWKYLDRAVDSQGNTLEFVLSAKRDAAAAELFWRKPLKATPNQVPRVINVDRNAAYPPAVDQLKADEQLSETTQLRQVKYLNNQVELSAPLHQATDKTGNGLWFL